MNTVKKTYTAFNYFGGKTRHLDWLLPLFPNVNSYKHYIEPFCGSAVVFLNKQPSPIETINDLDGNLVNFFQVLRQSPDILIRQLELTAYSRSEFMLAMELDISDPIERARRFFVRCMQSFGGGGLDRSRPTSWRIAFKESRAGMSCEVHKYLSKVSGLYEIVERLKVAQIENRDYEFIIKKFSAPDSFIYCDSPYVHFSRTGKKDYKHEFTDKQHRTLAKLLYKCPGLWAVSGYDSPLYKKLFTDKGYFVTAGPKKRVNLGNVEKSEMLWTNYDPQLYKSLKLF